jgi:hypothetical protein
MVMTFCWKKLSVFSSFVTPPIILNISNVKKPHISEKAYHIKCEIMAQVRHPKQYSSFFDAPKMQYIFVHYDKRHFPSIITRNREIPILPKHVNFKNLRVSDDPAKIMKRP